MSAATSTPRGGTKIQSKNSANLVYCIIWFLWPRLPTLCSSRVRAPHGVQGQHKINGYVFTSLFSACAAYKSAELRVVMTDAHRSLISHWRQLKASGSVSRQCHE